MFMIRFACSSFWSAAILKFHESEPLLNATHHSISAYAPYHRRRREPLLPTDTAAVPLSHQQPLLNRLRPFSAWDGEKVDEVRMRCPGRLGTARSKARQGVQDLPSPKMKKRTNSVQFCSVSPEPTSAAEAAVLSLCAHVIDFTRYDLKAQQPAGLGRNWSLMNRLNQKGTRPKTSPLWVAALPAEDQTFIRRRPGSGWLYRLVRRAGTQRATLDHS